MLDIEGVQLLHLQTSATKISYLQLHLILFRDYLRVLSGDIDTELGVDPEEDLEPGKWFSIEEHLYQIHLSYLFKGCVPQRGISIAEARICKSS